MGFWTAITIIVIVAIGTEFVIRVVKIGTRYSENVERIKRGYPTLDGAQPQEEKDELGKQIDRLQ